MSPTGNTGWGECVEASSEMTKDTGISILSQILKTVHIPAMSGSGGAISYEIDHFQSIISSVNHFVIEYLLGQFLSAEVDTVARCCSISLQELSFPKSDILLIGTGLTIHVANGFLKIKGHWSYETLFISGCGSFNLSVDGLGLTTVLRFTKDVGGRPTVQTVDCSATVGDVHVKLHGGASWFYNLFRSTIGHEIRDNLKRQICPEVINSVDKGLEGILQTLADW
uniref:bactericidal permeability-increasing protein-like isoform X2 n=1 Tax=Myxine glutinosa TaxID=7769 RepID=UPI00358E7AE7